MGKSIMYLKVYIRNTPSLFPLHKYDHSLAARVLCLQWHILSPSSPFSLHSCQRANSQSGFAVGIFGMTDSLCSFSPAALCILNGLYLSYDTHTFDWPKVDIWPNCVNHQLSPGYCRVHCLWGEELSLGRCGGRRDACRRHRGRRALLGAGRRLHLS